MKFKTKHKTKNLKHNNLYVKGKELNKKSIYGVIPFS